jgi:CubicO group peptidase (beta-lactamase class C family)
MPSIWLRIASVPFLLSAMSANAEDDAIDRHSSSNQMHEGVIEAFDQIASEFPGLSATVFVGDERVLNRHHGHESLTSATPIGPDSKFNIYSTSKAMTGIALGRLLQRKGLPKTITVGEIAPDLPARWHGISIGDILSHRSGIRHYASPLDWLQFAQKSCASPADALEYFAQDELLFEPGSEEHYSSFAYVLASELLLRLSDEERFAAALNDALGNEFKFELDSILRSRPPLLIDAAQLPEQMRPKGASGIIEIPPLSAACKFGGGGLVSNASELARVGTLLFSDEGQYSSLLDLEDGSSSPIRGVQLGAAVKPFDPAFERITSYSLSGGAPGGRSFLLVLLEPQISVAITANFDGPNLEEAAKEIARVWLDRI